MSQLAQSEMSKICSSWTASYWDELDWSRIKELSVRDTLEKRKKEIVMARNARCVECPNFARHVSNSPFSNHMYSLMAHSFLFVTMNGLSRKKYLN